MTGADMVAGRVAPVGADMVAGRVAPDVGDMVAGRVAGPDIATGVIAPAGTALPAAGEVVAALREIFATMIDGEPGHLAVETGEAHSFADPLHAWVDTSGTYAARTVLITEPTTAARLTRAMCGAGPEEELEPDEIADALGEIVNMLAGSVAAARPTGGGLGLPQVSRARPDGSAGPEADLLWHGAGITVAVLQPG
ncbi:chemotaxis protein CheX [Georgenia subflava]|uniref:Chemotaxis phosphatase CheX-like domain-containing protein n=1 Tax=Georgenia subflava TaxID=1622177 RepID=A0A6N7ENG3_9MICO|nr:chemotaxis protein CheX [Georgenia subflava]MPV38075.1 hypothetical protein [Georgenia subflava]